MDTRDERLEEEEGTGKELDRRIWEPANLSVRSGAFQSHPTRKAGRRVANIVPSRRAAVNNPAKDSGIECMNVVASFREAMLQRKTANEVWYCLPSVLPICSASRNEAATLTRRDRASSDSRTTLSRTRSSTRSGRREISRWPSDTDRLASGRFVVDAEWARSAAACGRS